MGKDLQWKYQNNKIISDGYIRGEITQEDCPIAGAEFYVATIPAGSILKGMTMIVDGYEVPAAGITLTVDVGMNDCQLCMGNDFVFGEGVDAVCNTSCACSTVDQDYLVRVTLTEDIPEGSVLLLVEGIFPEHVICAVEPIPMCYETTIVDPCTGGCECDDTVCGTVILTTVAAAPATASVDDSVATTVTITNAGTVAANDVYVLVDLPAGYNVSTESYTVSTGSYNPSTNMFTVPRMAAADTAVLTITGTMGAEITLVTTRAEAAEENTSPGGNDTLTATTTVV